MKKELYHKNKNLEKYKNSRSSAGKEFICNSGDPGQIPGLGSSPGEGIGYPLQYSWASLVAQMVKNLPAMWETSVQPLGWEYPLEEGIVTHSSILAWRISMDRGAQWATVHGVTESNMTEQLSTAQPKSKETPNGNNMKQSEVK